MASNNLLNPTIITKRAMVEFKNEMVLLSKVDRQLDTQFERKIGDTVNVRKRVRYVAGTGANITSNIEDTIEGSIAVQLDQRKNVNIQFDSAELTLDIEEFADRYIKPAMVELAQVVESAVADLYKEVWNLTGTPGTDPTTFLQIGTASTILDENAVPMGSNVRSAVYTPSASLTLADGLKGVFPTTIAEKAIEQALIGDYAGFKVYKSQSLKTHTVGAHGGTPAIDGASQNVTYTSVKDSYSQSLVTKDWTNSVTGILLEGDTFTIANVFSVNPRTRQSTGRLQSFVVRADANSGASTGPATLTISPAIITSGAYQTVNSVPADSALITVTSGTAAADYTQNLAFHKDAFTVAFAQLAMPVGDVMASRESLDGVSVRSVAQYDVLTDINTYRFDILFGVKAQNPGMAIRHVGV